MRAEQSCPHAYRRNLIPSEWKVRDGRRERALIPVPVCKLCGQSQPTRRARAPLYIEATAYATAAAPQHLPGAREAAALLIKTPDGIPRPCRGLFSVLIRRGVPQSAAEDVLDAF